MWCCGGVTNRSTRRVQNTRWTPGGHWRLALRLSDQLKPGLIGLPLGMAGLPSVLQHARLTELQEAIA